MVGKLTAKDQASFKTEVLKDSGPQHRPFPDAANQANIIDSGAARTCSARLKRTISTEP